MLRRSFIALVPLIALWAIGGALPVYGQETAAKSYYYSLIDAKYTINQDTTVDVEERQTLEFTGSYHQVFRDIPFNKIDDISDIQVFENDQPLKRSLFSLDKTQSSSWGNYYYTQSGGQAHIEWYFDSKLPSDTRTWTIKYKVHGALTFAKDEHRFYWNVFDDYSVNILQGKATVAFAEPHTKQDIFGTWVYRDGTEKYWINPDPAITDTHFWADYFTPGQAFTIDLTFDKKLVDQNAYWWDFIKIYWPYFLAFILVAGSFLYMALMWYVREYRTFKSKTIVPEYAPPQNLPPAMMSYVVNEKVVPVVWAATVVDLAVRGYLKIEEEEIPTLHKVGNWIGTFVFVFFSGFVFLFVGFMALSFDDLRSGLLLTGALIFVSLVVWRIVKQFQIKWYKLVGNNIADSNSKLEKYERRLLESLLMFSNSATSKKYFSTKELRSVSSSIQNSELYRAFQTLKLDLLEETTKTTGGYVGTQLKVKNKSIVLSMIIFLGIFGLMFIGPQLAVLIGWKYSILIAAILWACFVVFWLVKNEVRLNEAGNDLKRACLGFKLYLKTAERYRMQNLSPELFEKYLPYAMVFGVEKKWAKAFEGMAVPAPNWYSSGGSMSAVSSGGLAAGSFSAGAFSSSFASSFSSSFSSGSGSGGSGGGGGSSGGGGGGGGGGAS